MHLCERLGKRQSIVPRERPDQSRDGSEDVEERDGDDDADYDDEEVGCGFGPGRLVVDLDDGHRGCGYDGGVADGEEDGGHEGELHDGVEDDGEDHGTGDADTGFLHLVGHVHDAVC